MSPFLFLFLFLFLSTFLSFILFVTLFLPPFLLYIHYLTVPSFLSYSSLLTYHSFQSSFLSLSQFSSITLLSLSHSALLSLPIPLSLPITAPSLSMPFLSPLSNFPSLPKLPFLPFSLLLIPCFQLPLPPPLHNLPHPSFLLTILLPKTHTPTPIPINTIYNTPFTSPPLEIHSPVPPIHPLPNRNLPITHSFTHSYPLYTTPFSP